MKPDIYPKLHLPPDFYEEIGEEEIEMKQWFGAAYVELEDGDFVRPLFMGLSRVKGSLENMGYYCNKDSVILPEVTLDKIRQVLPELDRIGALNIMTRYALPEWNA